MANKLVVAAAGSWKTTFLINKALKAKWRVLITTFTECNEAEIRKKILEMKGYIPRNIVIQTWFSFLLQHWARPYQWEVFEKRINGLLLVEEKSWLKKKMWKFNQYYKEEETEKHYFSPTGKVYSDKLSRFVIKCNTLNKWNVVNRLSKIYKNIFIDEVQDLAWYDLDIIKLLFNSKSNILLVGDPRQVTYLTHFSTKYRKYNQWWIKDFIEYEYINTKNKCHVDTASFNHSYRNNQLICDFSSKLYPRLNAPISKQSDVTTHEWVFLIHWKDVNEYQKEFNSKVLRYRKAWKWELTFWISKWLWFDRVLIYPTKPIITYLKDWNVWKLTSIAKFYVALTRAKFSVWIVFDYTDNEEFIEWVEKWINVK